MSATLPTPLVGPTAERRRSDTPYPWRGLLLDCARTYFPVDTIERLLAVMGRYGMTHLQWHLTDNSGWRLEVPGYPQLAEVGAHLPRFSFADYASTATSHTITSAAQQAQQRWRAGMYSAEDVRRVLAAAKHHGIDVVPEIDLPGHMGAAIASYPTLGCPAYVDRHNTGDPSSPFRNDVLWPSQESEQFIRHVLEWVCELFPAAYVHLGGDECHYPLWESDKDLMARMRAQGMRSAADIQTYFMQMAAEVVRTHGRQPMAWDEVGAIDPRGEYLIVAWDGERGMERIAQSTQPYIYADMRWLYLNYVDPDGAADQLGMIPPTGVDDILTAAWPEADSPRCRGIQACLWTEFVLDEAALWDMLVPRLLAVVERMWDPSGVDRATAWRRVAAEADWLRGSCLVSF